MPAALPVDVVIAHQFAEASLYRNETNQKGWIGFELRGNGARCNADALGSKVTIETPSGEQMRETQASNGFSAQGDRRLLFGLGSHRGAVKVRIEWCGGYPSRKRFSLQGFITHCASARRHRLA